MRTKKEIFGQDEDITDYFDAKKAQRVVFPNLKPSTESISLRLPSHLLARIKEIANKKDVPYQSLMKIFLSEKVEKSKVI